MNTTEQARDMLLELLAERKYDQDSLHFAVPDAERITAIRETGSGRAGVVFADGSTAEYTVTVTAAPEGGQG